MMHDSSMKSSCVQRICFYTLHIHIDDAWPFNEIVICEMDSCLYITYSHRWCMTCSWSCHVCNILMSTHYVFTWDDAWLIDDKFHWECCTHKMHQIHQLKLLGTHSNRTKISIWMCTARHQEIRGSWFGGFEACKICSGKYHTCMAHDALIMNTSHVIVRTH